MRRIPPIRPYYPIRRTFDEEVRLLAWSTWIDTAHIWFVEGGNRTRIERNDNALLWFHFRDSTYGALWGLMLAGSMMPRDSAPQWGFRTVPTLEKILIRKGDESTRGNRKVENRGLQLFDHPPSSDEIVEFIAGATGVRPGPRRLVIDGGFLKYEPYDMERIYGVVRVGTWREVTGETPTVSFPNP